MDNEILFKGCLFDLDGTLIDSYPAVIRSWTTFALKNNLDPDHVFNVIHGRPARESVYELLMGQDETLIENEIKWLEDQESQDTAGIEAIDGAIDFLKQLNLYNIPWAIVTSGTYPVASARIKAARLPTPPQLITADLITKGKPDPEPFLLGAEKIKVAIKDCIVFEDAPAGVQAGIASKAKVIGILSHHALEDQFPIRGVNNFSCLSIKTNNEGPYLYIEK